MDELAKGLRVSKKTIYKYFPSKSKLVDAAVKSFQKKIKKKINKIIDDEDNSISQIRALTSFFANLSLKVNERVMYDLQTHRPDLWKKIDEFRTKLIEEIWVKIINQGKIDGVIVDAPNEIIIQIVISAIRSVVNPEFLINHNYSIKEAFDIAFGIIIRGILTEAGLKKYNNFLQEK